MKEEWSITEIGMKYSKEQCRLLEHVGYKFVGYWDDLYHFQKGDHSNGFLVLKCNQEDIENGNVKYMMEFNLSR